MSSATSARRSAIHTTPSGDGWRSASKRWKLEFRPHLAAAAARSIARRASVDAAALARYIVALVEGSIMLTRTQRIGP